MRVLGIVPARGGSKGIPGKNLADLGGRPLIAHTIAAALAARRLTRTIVTTDSEEIAQAARDAGADVPFLRPAELATDTARAVPVMQHALTAVEAAEQARYDAIVMLQPTSPFRRAADIDGALELLERTGADAVISVTDVGDKHPARMKILEGDRLVDPPYCEEVENQPRQQLPPLVIRNGAIYATRRDVILGGSFKGRDCRAWVMDAAHSVNIDAELDLYLARWLLETSRV